MLSFTKFNENKSDICFSLKERMRRTSCMWTCGLYSLLN